MTAPFWNAAFLPRSTMGIIVGRIIFLQRRETKPFVPLVENAIPLFQSGLVKIAFGLALGGQRLGGLRFRGNMRLFGLGPRA